MREAAYLRLHRSGELADRAGALRERLRSCDLCPRGCRVDRLAGDTGVCGIAAAAVVASASPHFGEERPLVGRGGSGTIFFCGCNLRCAFCQNDDISMSDRGRTMAPGELAEAMLRLQEVGCHNVNLVTPSHVVPQILAALDEAAARGLRLPLVFNSGGYDTVQLLEVLDGVIDIYMPDAKFVSGEVSECYCGAADYPEVNREALREMHRQVGDLDIDAHGIAARGVLVRHLVMPDDLAGTSDVMAFLAQEVSTDTYVNLMDQYRPCGGAARFPEICRRVTAAEMAEARHAARSAGIERLDDQARMPWFG